MKSNSNILSDSAKNECTSCQFCESICPTNAITFSLNEDGFYQPKISDTCIECGICKKYCYKFNSILNSEDTLNQVKCYSVKSKDKNILKTSASGGVSTIIFKHLLKEGYKIVGVTYNIEKNRAETIVVEREEELDCLKGSKYMQTRNKNIFREVINTKNKYAIIGTPCSIYPISSWAKNTKQNDRFVFIDFFCHGTPSMMLWKKYSEEYIKKYNVKNIKFRSKHYGWHEFCHEFINDKKTIYSNRTEQDAFFTMFFDNHLLNLSCYGCKCRDSFDYCDIRLGDYWGSKYDTDIEGVSAMLLITQRAKLLFDRISNELDFNKESFEDVVKEQAYRKIYTFDGKIRDKYFKQLKTSRDINKTFKEYLSNFNLKKKIKRNLKIIIKNLPNPLVLIIRKIYHI